MESQPRLNDKWKMQACLTLNFKVWEGTLVKSYKTQLPGFFFLFYISFYISRYHFYKFLECHSTLSGKDFCSKFSFFNRFTPSLQHQPLNGQNLLDVTKVFCQFSLKCLLKYFFSRIFWQNFVKHFWKGSNYRLSGLLFRTYFKNSYFDTRISNYL